MLGCKAALKTQMGDRWNWKLSTQTCKRDLNVCISYIHAHIHTLRMCPTNTSCIHIPPTHLIYISHVHFPYPYPISTSHRQPFRAAGRDNHPVAGRKPDTSLLFFFFFPTSKETSRGCKGAETNQSISGFWIPMLELQNFRLQNLKCYFYPSRGIIFRGFVVHALSYNGAVIQWDAIIWDCCWNTLSFAISPLSGLRWSTRLSSPRSCSRASLHPDASSTLCAFLFKSSPGAHSVCFYIPTHGYQKCIFGASYSNYGHYFSSPKTLRNTHTLI